MSKYLEELKRFMQHPPSTSYDCREVLNEFKPKTAEDYNNIIKAMLAEKWERDLLLLKLSCLIERHSKSYKFGFYDYGALIKELSDIMSNRKGFVEQYEERMAKYIEEEVKKNKQPTSSMDSYYETIRTGKAKPRQRKDVPNDQILMMIQNNMTPQEIADHFRVSKRTINRRLRQMKEDQKSSET